MEPSRLASAIESLNSLAYAGDGLVLEIGNQLGRPAESVFGAFIPDPYKGEAAAVPLARRAYAPIRVRRIVYRNPLEAWLSFLPQAIAAAGGIVVVARALVTLGSHRREANARADDLENIVALRKAYMDAATERLLPGSVEPNQLSRAIENATPLRAVPDLLELSDSLAAADLTKLDDLPDDEPPVDDRAR